MKHDTIIHRTTYLLLMAALILIVWGCSDRAVNNDGRTMVKMETNLSVAELAQAVDLFRLTVSARDIEPIVIYQIWDGGPLTFALDIPAGPDRMFLLEGIASGAEFPGGDSVIYRGSAVSDIEPDVAVSLTIHLDPIVPLLRFSPARTEVASGESFAVEVEAFNLPTLRMTELRVLYDISLMFVDSAVKGGTLDGNDVLEIQVGSDVPGFQFLVADPDSVSIVDSTGYSHLATLYFTSAVTVDSIATGLEITPLLFATSDGSVILPTDVFSQTAIVVIGSYSGPVVKLSPLYTAITSSEHFALEVELFNMPNLQETELNLDFDIGLMQSDSVSKGLSLDAGDALMVSLGDFAAPYINVTDTTGGLIVDSEGYSHLAVIYFSTAIIDLAAETGVQLWPVHFFLADSDSIPTADVAMENAIVSIDAFPDRVITFEDGMLEQAVRSAIFNEVDPILLSQVWNLDSLSASYWEITSLVGIEELVNLIYLDLSGNMISNVAPLAPLSALEWLSLQDNAVANASSLNGLVRLRHLNLRHNALTAVPDLSSLTALTELDLANLVDWPGGNSYSDISPLASLTQLTDLDIGWIGAVSNITPLSSLTNLTRLNLEWNSVADLSALTGLANLRMLAVRGNSITSVLPLINNTNFATNDTLDIQSNPLTNTACYDQTLGIPAMQLRGVIVFHDCGV